MFHNNRLKSEVCEFCVALAIPNVSSTDGNVSAFRKSAMILECSQMSLANIK
jgi:hypothetical protein